MNNIDPNNEMHTLVLPVFYKWQVSTDKGSSFVDLNNSPNSPSLSITNIDGSKDDYQYRVVVTSGNSTVISKPAALQVYPKINITQQPSDQVAQNGNAVFMFNATSSPNATATYQWEYSTKDSPTIFYPVTNASGIIAQENSSPIQLSLSNLTRTEDDNRYRVKILSGFNTNFQRIIYSDTAKLDILGSPIVINEQPQDVFTTEDSDATFFVTASTADGTILSYQWQESSDSGETFTNIDLATTSYLTINSLNKNQYQYRVIISSEDASVVSSAAVLHTGVELMSTSNVMDNTRLWGDPHLTLVSSKGAFARMDDNCCNSPILFFYVKYDNGDTYKLIVNNRFRFSNSTSGPTLISAITPYKNGTVITPTVRDSKSTNTPSTSLSLGSCTVAGSTGWTYVQGRCLSLSTVASERQLNDANYARLITNSIKWITKNKTNPSILIISSGLTTQNNTLRDKLLSLTPSSNITITGTSNLFTNANNILYQKDIVILQTQYNSSAMPDAGQRALLDYVKAGGGLLTTEWTIYLASLGRYNILKDAFPVYPTSSFNTRSPIRYIQNIAETTLNNNLSNDFSFIGSNNGGTATELLINTAKPGSNIFYHSEQCKPFEIAADLGGMLDIIDLSVNDPNWGGIYHSPIIKWQNIINYSGKAQIGGALYWILKSNIEYQKNPKNSAYAAWKSSLVGPTIDSYGLVMKPFNITRSMLTNAANAADGSAAINAVTENITMSDKFWKNMTKLMRGLVPDDKPYVKNIVYITKQPSNRLGGINGSVTFECVARSTNSSVLSYQWQISSDNGTTFSNVAGGTLPTLTITNLTTANNNKQYRVIISSVGANRKISNNVTLNVIQSISVSVFPTAQTTQNGYADFYVSALSTEGQPLSYQWQKSTRVNTGFSNISGAIYSTLSLRVTSTTQNNTYYRVIISDGLSSFTTNPVKLTAVPTLSISVQPTNFSTADNTATFNVLATGTSPISDISTALTYQWQYSSNNRTWYNIAINNSKYKNSNTSVLSLINLTRSQDDKLYFRVVIRNGTVSVTSTSAQLIILSTISAGTISYSPLYKKVGTIDYVDLGLSINASTTFGSLSYQWQQSTNAGKTYSNITGATSNTIGVKNIPKNSYSNYRYRVLISNSIESIMVY